MSYKVNRYPDGSAYIEVVQFNRDINFKINSYEDLWLLNQLVDVYNNNNLVPKITIPNLIDAQADRRFKSNQPHGLKLVCDFLNTLNAEFRIFHPHNAEVVEALIDKVGIIDNESFIRRVLYNYKDVLDSQDNNNLILMSSDAGGFKPLMNLCDKISWQGDVYSASKSRSYKDGNSKLVQIVDREDFEGKDILIIDDISVYGGTFKGLSKLLKERNCGKLYLAVSHMTVEELGDDPVTNYFDKVFTTNSKFDKYYGDDDFELKNLEIIKLF